MTNKNSTAFNRLLLSFQVHMSKRYCSVLIFTNIQFTG